MKIANLKALVAAAFFITSASYAAGPERSSDGVDTAMPIEQLHKQLKLTAAQEKEWQDIAAQAKADRQSMRGKWEEIRKAYEDELSKPEPDLARVATQANEAQDQRTSAARALQQRELKFYASLSPEQKSIVRDALKARLERRDQRREQLKEKRDQRRSGPEQQQ